MAIVERGTTHHSIQQAARGQPAGQSSAPPGGSTRAESHSEAPFTEDPTPPYAELLADPRVRRWAIRIGVAVAIGVLFALVFDLRVGFSVAVLAAILDTVRRARSSSSVEAWQKSSAAERRTERQLKGLEKAGYRVLHARAVPRDAEGASDGRIDHLVIGPSGVYAIDSEKWDKRLPVRTLSHRKLFHGPFDKKEQLDEARWEADQASKIISAEVGFAVPVQPSVAIYGPAIPWKVMTVRDVDVYSGGRAKSYLKRRSKILTSTDIERIHRAAEAALPPVYG
jgi:hypothetical protein